MNRDQKAAVVEEIAEEIRGAGAVFAVDYRGLSVPQAAELRARLRDADTKFRIVKNSLTERAADQAGADGLKALLEGPTAIALVRGDAAMAAKALNDTARAFGLLEFKGGLLDGAVLSADEVRTIARLPAREVLHAQLVGTIAAPLSGLVRGLNALIAGLAIQLKAIADQGLVGGSSDAEPARADESARSAADDTAASDGPTQADSSTAPDSASPSEDGEAEAAETPAEVPAATEPAAEAEPAEQAETESQPESGESSDA